MPGKVKAGTAVNPTFRSSKAYAEGREASKASAAQNTNPHANPSPAYTAWDAGWLSYVSGGGTTLAVDNCATRGLTA
jgi:hypothetical protein